MNRSASLARSRLFVMVTNVTVVLFLFQRLSGWWGPVAGVDDLYCLRPLSRDLYFTRRQAGMAVTGNCCCLAAHTIGIVRSPSRPSF